MAISGRKPTSVALKLITGNPGRRPLPEQRPTPPPDQFPGGPIERPEKLRGIPAKLWDHYIVRCHWLTWADGPKALMWCHLQAEYQRKPTEMIASRIAQLRTLGSELGFDQASRDRMGITIPTGREPTKEASGAKKPKTAAEKYFD